MELEQHIEKIREGLKAGSFTNEASVSQGIVLRLLQALSWPTYDVNIVSPEYTLRGVGRVDFALISPRDNKPIAFIEVKRIGNSDGAEKQLFDYAVHTGVPFLILTDGQLWNFFLPNEQGDYGDRRVYKLDITEREVPECVYRLDRYLDYEKTLTKTTIDSAREDLRNASRKKQMEETLPKALRELIDEEDNLLLEIVADKVENLCGYKPDLDMVAKFLKNQPASPPPPILPPPPKPPKPPGTAPEPRFPQKIGFSFKGKWHEARNAKDVMVQVIEMLSERDKEFLNRFARMGGSKRRWVAEKPDDLFPNRPDLALNHSYKLKSGWYLGTNESNGTKTKIIEAACETARIKFGSDLTIILGD